MTNTPQRSLYEIATEIRQDWKKVYFGAVPYLDAMSCLTNVTDKYGYDDGETMVLYFLSNTSSWKGETAKRIKTELKKMVGAK